MLSDAKYFAGKVGTEGEDISYVLGVTAEKGDKWQATDFFGARHLWPWAASRLR